jgi:hypothetical protein
VALQEQRQKLEEAVHVTQERLRAGKQAWRHLHMKRRTLQQRLSSPSPPPSRPLMHARPGYPLARPSVTSFSALSSHQSAAKASTQKARLYMPPDEVNRFQSDASRSCTHAHELVTAPMRSRGRLQSPERSQKPISAYMHHAPISFSAINKFMTSGDLRCQELRHAVACYQADVANRLRLPVEEICWFLELPYADVSPQLSASTSAASPECRCSVALADVIVKMECFFLIMEYEYFASASDACFKPTVHSKVDELVPTLMLPRPPDPAALAKVFMRCGVNQRMHAAPAVRGVLEPLLQKYKALLPLDKWLTVCLQCMRVVRAVGDALRAQPEQRERTVHGDQKRDKADQVRCMLHAVHQALRSVLSLLSFHGHSMCAL